MLPKIFSLKLPDPIPQDIRGPNRLTNETQRLIAQNLKGFAGITDENIFKFTNLIPKPGERPNSKIVVDPAISKRLFGKLAVPYSQVGR